MAKDDKVIAANAAFYAAFSTGDFDEMERMWAEDDAISCIHPGWPAIIGGLAMLAAEFVWARRLLNRLKSEGERLRQTVMPPWNSKA